LFHLPKNPRVTVLRLMKNVLLRLSVFLSFVMTLVRVSAADTGIVEGVIKYLPDSKRPWKFSRYYIQNAKNGSLAEAVVALEKPGLNALAPPAPPNKCTMDQINYQFVPETMAIRAGDTVLISNSDDALHNVMTSDGGEPFNVNVVKGKEFVHTFNQAGGLERPVRLGCVFHGAMRAWIYVLDHPWFQLTQKDGRFRLENVPAGEYTFGIVHPAGKLRRSRQIEVKANETTSLEISLSPYDLIAPTAMRSRRREEADVAEVVACTRARQSRDCGRVRQHYAAFVQTATSTSLRLKGRLPLQ
jgi:plastocyanin